MAHQSSFEVVSPVPVQQPTAVVPAEHAVVDEEAQISEQARPESNTGWFWSLVNLTLGPHQSDPIWQLILLAVISLVVAAMIGVLFLPKDLHEVRATYHREMLIMTVGIPILVAVITLLVSFPLATDPKRWSNWITGLSVANVSMLAGPLSVYWLLTLGTRN